MSLHQLSETIIKYRKKKKWSQAETAKYAGLSLNTYRRIEDGFIEEIGITKVNEVLDLFGLEMVAREKNRPLTLEELQSGQTY
ncbi:helix-turn-helix domain-containing protein [Sulfurovum mangrovi]|uniref:helix-turn-helix domain-containing protein n=1 Tax=Sulfurovum mangrovi TaxID=2893889 RepID=UPI001E59E454|nr:helix-turn-helix domain-containing protein [Sulfurovum mangrovi]UFH58340.1 helix-turn-helix domain-containing protein [Sulfurovum mangrovi]